MKRRIPLLVIFLLAIGGLAEAGEVTVGLLSFDQFIPASGTAAGVNSFDIFNFTGPSFGPAVGPPYASDSLTFTGASLTVNIVGGSSQTISLGDIGPGELLDTSGNPPVDQQFPSTGSFSSAVFTATLNPTTFTLSDGTTFTADGSITADLTPSTGSTLVAGTDFALINAQPAQVSPVPEPSTLFELFIELIAFSGFWLWKRKTLKFR